MPPIRLERDGQRNEEAMRIFIRNSRFPAMITGDLRAAIIKAKRELGPERGYTNYKDMTDQQLVDYFHCTMFPNVTLTMSPEQCQILRTEPHPTDPEKCVFQHWCLYPPNAKMAEVVKSAMAA